MATSTIESDYTVESQSITAVRAERNKKTVTVYGKGSDGSYSSIAANTWGTVGTLSEEFRPSGTVYGVMLFNNRVDNFGLIKIESNGKVSLLCNAVAHTNTWGTVSYIAAS